MLQRKSGPVIFLSRTMPHYRLPIIEEVDRLLGGKVVLVYSGAPIPGEKNNKVTLSKIVHTRTLSYVTPFSVGRYRPGYLRGLLRLFFELRPSVIVTEGESNIVNNLLVFSYSLLTKTPYIWWGCGRVRNRPVSLARRLLHPFLKLLIGRAWGVIGYSSYACEYYSKTYGFKKERAFCACNSLHRGIVEQAINSVSKNARNRIRTLLNIGADDPVMLYVGALVPPKRPEFIVEIHRLLQSKLPNLHSIIVGGGTSLKSVTDAAENLTGVHIVGKVIDGVEEYFLAGDVFIMPGLGGLGLQQAMMCSLPAVVTIADGTEVDLVQDGKNGYVIDPTFGAEIWAEKIGRLFSSKMELFSMGAESKRIVDEEFNSDIMTKTICEAVTWAQKLEQ